MRGKLYMSRSRRFSRGITPADAGKTIDKDGVIVIGQDHPRGCGENTASSLTAQNRIGSPPRMRGKQSHGQERFEPVRITPADAGKTVPVFGHRAHNRDHPRGCGENTVQSPTLRPRGGSPPRMRGKLIYSSLPLSVSGITPADAGKTIWVIIPVNLHRDHPRGCGENLSPRIALIGQLRITPADAGKTERPAGDSAAPRDHPRGCGENSCMTHPALSRRRITPADAGKTS